MERGELISAILEQAIGFIIDAVISSTLLHLVGAGVMGAVLMRWFLGDKFNKRIADLEERLNHSKQIIDKTPPPETKTWIGKAVVRHIIMESSLMLKIVAGLNRPGDYHSTGAFLERAKNRALFGSSDKDAYEARKEEEAFQYYLEKIVTEYPEAQNKDGGYSKEIIEFALKKMAVEE